MRSKKFACVHRLISPRSSKSPLPRPPQQHLRASQPHTADSYPRRPGTALLRSTPQESQHTACTPQTQANLPRSQCLQVHARSCRPKTMLGSCCSSSHGAAPSKDEYCRSGGLDSSRYSRSTVRCVFADSFDPFEVHDGGSESSNTNPYPPDTRSNCTNIATG